jgi:hypothetical protein
LFDIEFNAPQNFAAYRQTELDTARVTVFQTMEAFPYMSKRFAMQRFLGLTEEEIEENSRMWHEEKDKPEDGEAAGSDLRSIGISAGDIDSDLEDAENLPDENAEGGMPGETIAPVNGPENAPPGAMTNPQGLGM